MLFITIHTGFNFYNIKEQYTFETKIRKIFSFYSYMRIIPINKGNLC